MKKIITLLLFLNFLNLHSQEYYAIGDKNSVFTFSDFNNKIKLIEENWNKKDSMNILKVDYDILKTIKRKDSIINIVQFNFDIRSKASKKEKIYELENKTFPNFSLENLNGETLDFNTLKTKITFINLWFVNCPPCIKEIPLLNKLKTKYNNDVNFVAITFDSNDKVKNLLKKHRFDFIHLVNAKQFLENQLGVINYPKNIIIDKNGVIRFIDGGIPVKFDISKNEKFDLKSGDSKYLEKILNKLLIE